MRISDWSSDVCSSDLCELRDTTAMLRHHVDTNSGRTLTREAQLLGSRIGHVDDARIREWSAIVDANDYAAAVLQVRHPYAARQLTRRLRGGLRVHREEERRVGKGCVSQCRSRW